MLHTVEAQSMLEAAQKLCDEPLTENQRPAMYRRADVRTPGKLNEHNYFYAET